MSTWIHNAIFKGEPMDIDLDKCVKEEKELTRPRKAEMIPVCQLIWDSTAFEHSRFMAVLPKIVESIQREGYRMNGDGVLQVSRLADGYRVITGRLQSIAAAMCKVKEVPALVYPEGANLDLLLMRHTTCTHTPSLNFDDKLACARFMMSKGATHKDLRKAFGYYYARKLIKSLE